jgi:tetratricopeptide (TPR) repeat protein
MSAVRHPAERSGNILLAAGAATAGLGVAMGFGGEWYGGLLFEAPVLGVGGVMAAAGAYLRVAAPLVMQINGALNELHLGRFDEARGLLDAADERVGRRLFGFFGTPVLLQRGELAVHDGRPEEALALFERAAAEPLGFQARWHKRALRAEAYASAALVRAGAGDVVGAREAIDKARAPSARPPARARATVAELVLLARTGDHDGLRRSLDEHRSLLFEATTPRERALVRAMDRMLDQAARSPYREPAAKSRDTAAGVTGWISDVVPDAAPYVADRDLPTGTAGELRFDAPTAAGKALVESDRAKGARTARRPTERRALLLWAALVAMFLGIWWVLQPPAATHTRAPAPAQVDGGGHEVALFVGLYFVVVALLVAFRVWKNNGTREAARAAALALAEGHYDRVRELLRPVLDSRVAAQLIPKAEAWLLMSQLEEREASFPKALAACDQALGALGSRAARAASYDLLLPAVHAQRAFVLAVLGRTDESNAEVSQLLTDFPSYAHKGVVELRLKLAQLARSGDRAEAARVGRERSPYLQLDLREEALLDVVDALALPPDDAERARVRHRVESDRRLGAWLTEVAPSLTQELRHGAAPRTVTA